MLGTCAQLVPIPGLQYQPPVAVSHRFAHRSL